MSRVGDDLVFNSGISQSIIRSLDNIARQQKKSTEIMKDTTPGLFRTIDHMESLFVGTREISDSTNYFTAGLVTISGGLLAGNKILLGVATTAQAVAAGFSIYQAYKSIIAAKEAMEASMAAIETTALAIVQEWGQIIFASIIAGGVGAALGYYASKSVSAQTISTANINTAMGRRKVARSVKGVNG